jgi:hypothetical protein
MRYFLRVFLILSGCALVPACGQTQQNGPAWQTGPTVTSNSGGMVTLGWTAAIDNAGGGLSYALYMGNGGSGTEDTNNPAGGTPTSLLTATVSGLTATNHYWFFVVATDVNGNTTTSGELEVIAN